MQGAEGAFPNPEPAAPHPAPRATLLPAGEEETIKASHACCKTLFNIPSDIFVRKGAKGSFTRRGFPDMTSATLAAPFNQKIAFTHSGFSQRVFIVLFLFSDATVGRCKRSSRTDGDHGLVLLFAAILGRLWSILYIGSHKNRRLVTDGPYSITRNPLYLFSLTAITGIGLMFGSLLITVALTGTAFAIFRATSLLEAAHLRFKFGAAYDAPMPPRRATSMARPARLQGRAGSDLLDRRTGDDVSAMRSCCSACFRSSSVSNTYTGAGLSDHPRPASPRSKFWRFRPAKPVDEFEQSGAAVAARSRSASTMALTEAKALSRSSLTTI